MKTKYQSGFKEQALRKVFARASDRTVESIAIDLNMNIGTLRGWMKNASRDGLAGHLMLRVYFS